MTRWNGFTLAELLIAMTILGVIATYTIPKVLAGQNAAKRSAIFRETIGAFSEAYYLGYIQGEVTEANVATFFQGKMNAIKVCPDSTTGGCWTQPAAIPGYVNSSSAAFKFASGATAVGMDNAGSVGYDAFIIDWDGASGLNQEGDDQVVLKIILDPAQGKVGTITSYASRAASKTLFESIFGAN